MTRSVVEQRISNADRLLTPALLIFPEIVDSNIRCTLQAMGDDPGAWRPHVKTAKLAATIQRLTVVGVTNFKCSNTLELKMLLEAGARDVLVSHLVTGANAIRVKDIVKSSRCRISALVEHASQISAWENSGVDLFVDLNPGMDRTGVAIDDVRCIIELVEYILKNRIKFRGLHFYDGHLAHLPFAERVSRAHQGYDRLLELVDKITRTGIPIEEIITSGTPTFLAALSYSGFRGKSFKHRVSPGTVVYGDRRSAAQIPERYGYRPAVVVLSTVVSHPAPHLITCDGGSKSVSADSGVPTCEVLDRPDLKPQKPSEEHIPIEITLSRQKPAIGETLYLIPSHVCTTVNNFDRAWWVEDGKARRSEAVTARGREVMTCDRTEDDHCFAR
jgi:D-serine deaminase-like pyridoxal phosphate-dependent protein